MTESPIEILVGIGSELIPDAGIAEARATGSNDPLLWRSYVRAVFALIEGLNYARLHMAKEPVHVPAEAAERAREAARLEKKNAKADHAREVVVSTRVSFAAHAAAYQVQNPLTPSGSDWSEFLAAVAVRDRITHPKSKADCQVSDVDCALIRRVHHWYQQLDVRLMEASRPRKGGGVEQGYLDSSVKGKT